MFRAFKSFGDSSSEHGTMKNEEKKNSFAQEKIGPAAIFLNALFPALCNFEVQDVTNYHNLRFCKYRDK